MCSLLLALATALALPLAAPADDESPAAPTAAEPATIPDDGTPVIDRAEVTDDATRQKLAEQLADLKEKTGAQAKVLTVPSLAGEDIAVFSKRHANAWQLGRRDVNDGVLIVLAPNERKVRIAVGLGMERILPDSWCESISRQAAQRFFRKSNTPRGCCSWWTPSPAASRPTSLPATSSLLGSPPPPRTPRQITTGPGSRPGSTTILPPPPAPRGTHVTQFRATPYPGHIQYVHHHSSGLPLLWICVAGFVFVCFILPLLVGILGLSRVTGQRDWSGGAPGLGAQQSSPRPLGAPGLLGCVWLGTVWLLGALWHDGTRPGRRWPNASRQCLRRPCRIGPHAH